MEVDVSGRQVGRNVNLAEYMRRMSGIPGPSLAVPPTPTLRQQTKGASSICPNRGRDWIGRPLMVQCTPHEIYSRSGPSNTCPGFDILGRWKGLRECEQAKIKTISQMGTTCQVIRKRPLFQVLILILRRDVLLQLRNIHSPASEGRYPDRLGSNSPILAF